MVNQGYQPPKYYLLACGTAQYDNNAYQPNEKVRVAIDKISGLLTSKFPYKRILRDISYNPSKEITSRFCDWLRDTPLDSNDHVILYYTGHGQVWDNNKHYLILKDTNPLVFSETALPTSALIDPLFNLAQPPKLLFIIDTCHSGGGVYELSKEAFSLQEAQPLESQNTIVIQGISSCRSRELAKAGEFPLAFEGAINAFLSSDYSSYIYLDPLIPEINNRIQRPDQNCHRIAISGPGEISFFPRQPILQQTWEEQRFGLVQTLLDLLSQYGTQAELVVDSFVLAFKNLKFHSRHQLDIESVLKELSLKALTDGICPLLACSEWCQIIFFELGLASNLETKISTWQKEVLKHRTDANLDLIREHVRELLDEFRENLESIQLRFGIVLQQEIESENSELTGQPTGKFIVSILLFIPDCKHPLRLLKSMSVRINPSWDVEVSTEEIEQKLSVSSSVNRALQTIFDGFGVENDDVLIEFFLPQDYYQSPIEKMPIPFGDCVEKLDQLYPVIINSYSRYFLGGSASIGRVIGKKKDRLWGKGLEEPRICNENDRGKSTQRQFRDFDVFMGTTPSRLSLKMIERDIPIGFWSRDQDAPLERNDERFPLEQWKTWPHQLFELRQQEPSLKITLLWDDLTTKPPRPRPLSDRVVR